MSEAQAVLLALEIIEKILDKIDEDKRDNVRQRMSVAIVDKQAKLREAAQAALDAR